MQRRSPVILIKGSSITYLKTNDSTQWEEKLWRARNWAGRSEKEEFIWNFFSFFTCVIISPDFSWRAFVCAVSGEEPWLAAFSDHAAFSNMDERMRYTFTRSPFPSEKDDLVKSVLFCREKCQIFWIFSLVWWEHLKDICLGMNALILKCRF